MIPARFAPILFGFILSGLMSCMVAGIATFRAAGMSADFPMLWMGGWLASWAISFPVVLVVAPFTRKLVSKLIR